MRRTWWYLLGIVTLVLIIAIPYLLYPGRDFQGADDQGAEQTGAKPWFENVFKPPEGSEPLLFALTALAGVVVIAVIILYTKKRPREREGR